MLISKLCLSQLLVSVLPCRGLYIQQNKWLQWGTTPCLEQSQFCVSGQLASSHTLWVRVKVYQDYKILTPCWPVTAEKFPAEGLIQLWGTEEVQPQPNLNSPSGWCFSPNVVVVSRAVMNSPGFVEHSPVFQPAPVIDWNWPDNPKQHCMKYGPRSSRVRGQKQKCICFIMEKKGNNLLGLNRFIPPLLHLVVWLSRKKSNNKKVF